MKTDVFDLIEKAQDSIEASRLLLEKEYTSFAASRGYYAMFYVAEALLLDRDLSFSSHAAVISAFGREFAKTKLLDPEFHRYLIHAHETRNVADYGSYGEVTKAQANKMLEQACEFLDAAKQFLGD
jgi:uncharacterized protein (UPF0332 family)